MKIINTPSPHFNERKKPISYVVLHYTNMIHFNEALDVLTGRNTQSNGQVSAHYAISQSGIIHQLVDENKRAWHAGRSNFNGMTDLNSTSIGIELDNAGDFYFKEHGVWPAYSNKILNALWSLLNDIQARHFIPTTHIVGHCHVAAPRKIDPGPHFPWEQLWKRLDTSQSKK